MMVSPSILPGISSKDLFEGFVVDERVPEFHIGGLSADSRQVRAGDLFIAAPGLNSHAVDFVPEAVNAGAVGILYDEDDAYACQRIPFLQKQLRTHWVAIANLQQLTGELASRFYGHPSHAMKVVGVTGTDGKTSVTNLLVQALMNLGEPVGSIGTLGYGMYNDLQMTGYTTPDAINLHKMLAEFQQADCKYVVMEVSSHALQQHRVSGCVFDIAVLTNLGSDHLDYHGSVEDYAAAKSVLFESDDLKARVLNVDDAFGRQLSERFQQREVVSYAASPDTNSHADIHLQTSRITDKGLAIGLHSPAGEMHIQTGLIGAFNIDNCLACVAVLQKLGFGNQQIEQAMQNLRPIPGRMEYLPAVADQPAVVIDFAHTAQALEACLLALRDFTTGELICVFGCGGDRDTAKRPLMAAVAERLADQVVVTDDNPRHESPERIMRDILRGFEQAENVRVIHDRQAAIVSAIRQAKSGDLVVIAGKGHERVQIIGDQQLPFSDQQVVRQIRQEALS